MRQPGPAETFVVRTLSSEDPQRWYHVYSTAQYPNNAYSFAQGWGDTRFAPINLPGGDAAHTYYAASTAECAFMESVLHDVPLSPPGFVEVASLSHFHLVQLEFSDSLKYVSFHSPYLPQLGITRADLIDSLPSAYPWTRPWAQAALAQRPEAQAIGYGSRRDDGARCLMLAKQRLASPPFNVISVERMDVEPRRSQLLSLVRSLGIHEI